MRQQTGAPLTLFYSYAHEDEALREQLERHLRLLSRQGLISEWHDRQILAGEEWTRQIDEHLEKASVILLLISPDFLASDYCYDIEMQQALERHKCGEARVIPIILRPCDWHSAPFGRLQSVPRDGKPVTEWDNQDAAFRDITQGIRRIIEQRTSSMRPAPRLSPVHRQNRLRLLKSVRVIWIEGMLEHSLHRAVQITLDLQEQPDALANPWLLEVQETNLPPRPLPAGTSIVQVYDEAGGELLILGEPGAGKTTLLLELARILLERAEQDEHERLPIVFNLSSWAEKRLPLSEWLIEELRTKYQIPRTLGNPWIAANQILPLLDGLDEAAESSRAACIQAINAYHQEHLDVPLVVCSRSTEYYAQPIRIQMHKAVFALPLTDQQVEQYLASAQSKLEGVRHLLQQDVVMQELATTPLMLSILALAYYDHSPDQMEIDVPLEAHRQTVFAAYIRRMLQHREITRIGTNEQIRQWLTTLAVQMRQHHTFELFLEQVQPSWLTDDKARRLYRLSRGLVYGLVGTLGVVLLSVLLSVLLFRPGAGLALALDTTPGVQPTAQPQGSLGLLGRQLDDQMAGNRPGGGLLLGLISGLVNGLVGALVFGLVSWRIDQIEPAEVLAWSWERLRHGLGIVLINVLIPIFLVTVLSLGLPPSMFDVFPRLLLGLGIGLLFALSSALGNVVVGKLGVRRSKVQHSERSNLSPSEGIWRSARNGLLTGLIGGALVGLPLGMVAALSIGLTGGLHFGLIRGLFVSLRGWLLFSLVGGLLTGLIGGLNGLIRGLVGKLGVRRSKVQHSERSNLSPSESIWRSARNGLLTGLIGGTPVGLLLGMVTALNIGLTGGSLILGLFISMMGGLLFSMIGGLNGLIRGLVGKLGIGLSKVQYPERSNLSPNKGTWRFARNGLLYGLAIGLVVGLVAGPGYGLTYGLTAGLAVALVYGLAGALIGTLISGLSGDQLPERSNLSPNEGIWRSARNGLLTGLIGYLFTGPVFSLVVGLFSGLSIGPEAGLGVVLSIGLEAGLGVGLGIGLVFALGAGLGAFLDHFWLRLWLCQTAGLPWNLVAFLDEAAERLLLRKVGGGYIFIHRLLLDYFADLEKKDP